MGIDSQRWPLKTKQIVQPTSSTSAQSWQAAPALAVVILHFGLFGCLSGVNGVLWAELLAVLQVGEGPFGTAQLTSTLVATMILLRYAALSTWFGPKHLTIIGLVLAAVAMLILTTITTLWGFVASLALLGAGTSLLDGAMNQTAIDWEHATRRPVMNFIHACFSGGAVLGSLSAGAGLGAGWSYGQVLVTVALIYGISAALTLTVRFPPVTTPATTAEPGAWRPIVRNPTLRALMLICGLSIIVESVIFLWAVIYVRTELAAPVVLGSVAFAVFNGAMFVGRLLNGPIVARRGAGTSLLLSGAGLILGTGILIATNNVTIAIGALMLLGLAIAGIFPTVVAAAGSVLPGQSGALTGALMTLAYLCFMLAPPVIGWLAEWSSLRIAFIVVGLCGVGTVWNARRLPK
ncbi:MAG: hypothetical protein CYG59_01730 [Chloroflexi bacterium]|nr:MAG: hypothetical protein CYG59_01730 [Chloroflexota bacterium]